jgi:hypothetical protein
MYFFIVNIKLPLLVFRHIDLNYVIRMPVEDASLKNEKEKLNGKISEHYNPLFSTNVKIVCRITREVFFPKSTIVEKFPNLLTVNNTAAHFKLVNSLCRGVR